MQAPWTNSCTRLCTMYIICMILVKAFWIRIGNTGKLIFWHFIKGCKEYRNNWNTYSKMVTDKYDNTNIDFKGEKNEPT